MKKTPLHKVHCELGAKMIEFGAWEMPVQYDGIITEHLAVRKSAGLFDASHMGEFLFKGRDALKNLESLVSNNVARLEIGQVLYTPMCRDNGGIIDDLLIYRLSAEEYMLVVNASNMEKDYQWINKHIIGDIVVENQSEYYALIALQGPESLAILKEISTPGLEELKYYHFLEGRVAGIELIISRTGYTGELGYELYCSPDQAVFLWKELMKAGKEYNLVPAGLGARDTLRIEKKYCLYGNDIDEKRHPLEAGLSWTVDFSKDFIGKECLVNYQKNGFKQRLVGFKLTDRGVARKGYKIMDRDQIIGEVSSGSYSPTLDVSIGLGYVDKEYSKIDKEIEIIIRNKPVKAVIVKTPFV